MFFHQKEPIGDYLIEQPVELAPDLEWMLRSTQASPAMIVDCLVQEHYSAIYRPCYALLGDPAAAEQAALETMLQVVENRHRFRGRQSVQAWLAELALQTCRRRLRRTARWFSRPAARPLISGAPLPPPAALTTAQARLRRKLVSLPLKDLELLLLAVLFNLPAADLAVLLRTDPHKLQSRLDNLVKQVDREQPGEQLGAAQLHAALVGLYPPPVLSPEEEARLAGYAKFTLVQRQRRQMTSGWFLQAAAALGILVLVAGMAWLTSQMAARQTPNPFVARTVIVTHVVKVFITPTPRPTEPLPSLSPDSSPAQVRERIQSSARHWNIVWAEAVIRDYGPTGYIGPPLQRIEQIWINRPNQILILSGRLGEAVEQAFLFEGSVTYTIDLPTGRPMRQHQFRPEDVSTVVNMLLPERLLANANEFEILDQETVAGHPALAVRAVGQDGNLLRLMVHAANGTILGVRRYAADGFTVLADISFSQVSFDQQPALQVFDSGLMPTSYVVDYRGMPLLQNERAVLPEQAPVPPRKTIERVSPPRGYRIANSTLTFQWAQPPGDAPNHELLTQDWSSAYFDRLELVPLEIFTQGYFWGEVEIGNPWSLLCKRSPDGRKLAVLEMPEQAPFPSERLRWVDLSSRQGTEIPVHDLLPPDSSFGRDFAFSPDGSLLAFWGCGVRSDNCGIYVTDLETHKNLKVIPSGYVTDLVWSPEGDQLAADWWYGGRFAVDITTGVRRDLEIFPGGTPGVQESPLDSWAFLSEPPAGGLDACRILP